MGAILIADQDIRPSHRELSISVSHKVVARYPTILFLTDIALHILQIYLHFDNLYISYNELVQGRGDEGGI